MGRSLARRCCQWTEPRTGTTEFVNWVESTYSIYILVARAFEYDIMSAESNAHSEGILRDDGDEMM